ncbi:WSC domain-containing protein [Colletotrichum graminicola]|uniref:WSC domain-containing protein n=1 Tax=Colletotrichum graminicola (strain M1.001 / M2 / FGSC 10212) TaxID=645133 RepID=E3QCG9_COLGM|nr:WSC domain-containing protein [Colletotrichum graminicola M1.001]EFQ28557.1 WSC domain-containing protein [Colletotrichum graminicola M1.001]WDK15953.1 WSC domain-containing protein [Colletotrichum graminicola]
MAPLVRAFAAFAASAFLAQVTATTIELPPCLDDFQPFAYSGCFQEKGTLGEPVLDFRSSSNQSENTVEKCVADCKGNSYRYAGLTYYGVCYCGQTVNSPSLPEASCNMPCTANSSETCGGDGAFSIWQDTTFPSSTGVTINDYESIGCYTDDTDHGRTIAERQDQVAFDTMTPSSCLQACADDGYPFAGLEYGGECYCGVVMGNYTKPAAKEECNTLCNGDKTKTCGGAARVEIFVANKLRSLEPCGYKPPVNSVSSSISIISTTPLPPVSIPSTTNVVPTTISSQAPVPTTTQPVPTTISSQAPVPTTTQPVPTTISSQAPVPTTTQPVPTTISSQAPVPTTTKPVTTTQPATTTKPVTTSKPAVTTTAPAVCTTTIVTPPTCEYGCGNWCNKNLPDFDDADSCTKASNSCKLQVSACLGSGWPGSAGCMDFKAWCNDIGSYCTNSCKGKGSCSKKDCFVKKAPKGYKPGTTSVSTFPCPSKPTSTVSAAPTVVPPPPTGLCKQPSSFWYGYGPGKPVGGIEIPFVTCNDIAADFKAGNKFKLYTKSDSRSCKSFGSNNVPNACQEACQEQYNQCQNTYAQGCKAYNNRRGRRDDAVVYARAPEFAKRWFFSDSYSVAINKCKIQYNDCLSENRVSFAANKCGSFGTGY